MIINSLFSDAVLGIVTKVISGDTFLKDNNGKLYKFYFYRAPSIKTNKGQRAKKELEKLILNKEIRASVADDGNGYVLISDLTLYPFVLNKAEAIETILVKKKLLYQYRKRKYID